MLAVLPLQECFSNHITGLERKKIVIKFMKENPKLDVKGIFLFKSNVDAHSLRPYLFC